MGHTGRERERGRKESAVGEWEYMWRARGVTPRGSRSLPGRARRAPLSRVVPTRWRRRISRAREATASPKGRGSPPVVRAALLALLLSSVSPRERWTTRPQQTVEGSPSPPVCDFPPALLAVCVHEKETAPLQGMFRTWTEFRAPAVYLLCVCACIVCLE